VRAVLSAVMLLVVITCVASGAYATPMFRYVNEDRTWLDDPAVDVGGTTSHNDAVPPDVHIQLEQPPVTIALADASDPEIAPRWYTENLSVVNAADLAVPETEWRESLEQTSVEHTYVIPEDEAPSFQVEFAYRLADGTIAAVPEPSGIVALAGPVIAGLGLWRRRRSS